MLRRPGGLMNLVLLMILHPRGTETAATAAPPGGAARARPAAGSPAVAVVAREGLVLRAAAAAARREGRRGVLRQVWVGMWVGMGPGVVVVGVGVLMRVGREHARRPGGRVEVPAAVEVD